MAEKKEETRKLNKEQLLLEKKKATFNLVLLLAASFAVLVGVLTMAWFAMNTKVNGTNMSVTSKAQGFEIRVADGTIGYLDLYQHLDDELTGNLTTSTNGFPGGQVVRWRMEDGERAIRPGTQGTLEFEMISHGADIDNLIYHLQVTAFTATTDEVEDPDDPDETIEVVTGLTVINSTDSTEEELKAADYINSHVLFFTGRHGTAKDNYEYYGLIDSKEEFQLALDNGAGTIYWIWPNTLGQIAFSTGESDSISGTPVLYNAADSYATDRTKLTEYLKDNQAVFFSGDGTQNYSNLITSMYTKWETRNDAEPVSYQHEFEVLSEGYNAADQMIGDNVDYVLVQMIVDAH